MPRFFFHTQDGKIVHDQAGVELHDVQEARREAAGLIGQMLRDRPDELLDTESLSLTVADSDGLTYFTILVSSVNSPAAPSPPPPAVAKS